MKSRSPKGKGVPAYFSKLLGVAPQGVPPLRTPRSAIAPRDTVDVWQPLQSTAPAPPLRYELPAPAVETEAKSIASLTSPTRTASPLVRRVQSPVGPAGPVAGPTIDESPAGVAAPAERPPATAPPPAEVVIAEVDAEARGPEATRVGQPLVSILERASARFEHEAAAPFQVGEPQPAEAGVAPPRRSVPAHAGAALPETSPSAPAEPAIEIGHIEVRINPPAARPPVAQRHAPVGSLTRHGFIHGLGQG